MIGKAKTIHICLPVLLLVIVLIITPLSACKVRQKSGAISESFSDIHTNRELEHLNYAETDDAAFYINDSCLYMQSKQSPDREPVLLQKDVFSVRQTEDCLYYIKYNDSGKTKNLYRILLKNMSTDCVAKDVDSYIIADGMIVYSHYSGKQGLYCTDGTTRERQLTEIRPYSFWQFDGYIWLCSANSAEYLDNAVYKVSLKTKDGPQTVQIVESLKNFDEAFYGLTGFAAVHYVIDAKSNSIIALIQEQTSSAECVAFSIDLNDSIVSANEIGRCSIAGSACSSSSIVSGMDLPTIVIGEPLYPWQEKTDRYEPFSINGLTVFPRPDILSDTGFFYLNYDSDIQYSPGYNVFTNRS